MKGEYCQRPRAVRIEKLPISPPPKFRHTLVASLRLVSSPKNLLLYQIARICFSVGMGNPRAAQTTCPDSSHPAG